MGVSPFEEELPDNYLCELCAPDAHAELLAGIKRGEKLWETRRTAHEKEQAEQEEAEAEASKKKGRKGRGKATGKVDSPQRANSKAKSATPVIDVKAKKDPVGRGGSAKRKTRDESHDKVSLNTLVQCKHN